MAIKTAERLNYPNICKIYSNSYLHNILRTFHADTKVFGPNNLKNSTLIEFQETRGINDPKLRMLKTNQKANDVYWERIRRDNEDRPSKLRTYAGVDPNKESVKNFVVKVPVVKTDPKDKKPDNKIKNKKLNEYEQKLAI